MRLQREYCRACLGSTETGAQNYRGGGNVELEVIESKKCEPIDEPAAVVMGCDPGGFFYGCCIIHFWCWDVGQGLCC